MLKSTPNVWKSPRSGLNLEGRLSDPEILYIANPCSHSIPIGHWDRTAWDITKKLFAKIDVYSSATFDVRRNDGLGSRRNLLGVTLYEDL